jgi:hypothetical protein
MRTVLLIMMINLLAPISTSVADEIKLKDCPILGYASEKLLYVSTYTDQNLNIPENLYIYPNGMEVKAHLRKGNALIPPFDHYDDGSVALFVYEFDKEIIKLRDVMVFYKQKNLQYVNNKELYEPSSNTTWKLTKLISDEGFHKIITTFKNGKCISHIDYYTHLQYATEADSDEAFNTALCGQEISENNAHF